MAELKPIIEQSMTQYAGAVLQSRALVDVRDCLKPSARQIFFCMDKYKYTANKPFQKTMAAIGDAMKHLKSWTTSRAWAVTVFGSLPCTLPPVWTAVTTFLITITSPRNLAVWKHFKKCWMVPMHGV